MVGYKNLKFNVPEQTTFPIYNENFYVYKGTAADTAGATGTGGSAAASPGGNATGGTGGTGEGGSPGMTGTGTSY